jgi:hypothetical protein
MHITDFDKNPDADKYGLQETVASDTLRAAQRTKPTTTKAARALEIFQKLAPDEQEAHLDWLEQPLKYHDSGDGVPDGTAEKNRASLKNAQKAKKTPKLKRAEIEAVIKETFGASNTQLDKFVDVFLEAVESRAETVAFGNKIRELFESIPYYSLMFADDETIDAVELLSDRINDLEEGLQYAAEERAILEQELLERQSALAEETLFNNDAPSRSVAKRRSLDPDFTFNEEGEFLMEDGTRQSQPVSDPKMRRYAEVLARTTRNVDVHTPNENLLEAWKNN